MTEILFSLGLHDPRGLDFVSATVAIPTFSGPARVTAVNGWAVQRGAHPLLLTPRGDLVAVRSWGASVPLSNDALNVSPASSWHDARSRRAEGILRANILTAILLARLGFSREANERWRTAASSRTDGEDRSALLDFAETQFDSALGALRIGEPTAATTMLTRLECARSFIESHAGALTMTTTIVGLTPHSVQERSTEFLRAVPLLLAEATRVSTQAPLDVSTINLATAPVSTLIQALESIESDPSRPDEDSSTNHPIVRALRDRGPAIASELIAAFETDARLTRIVEHESYPLYRHPVPVRTPLAHVISEITGIYPVEWGWESFTQSDLVTPAAAGEALRRRWAAIGPLTPFERALQGISDPSASFERQILALATLFATTGEQNQRLLLRANGPMLINPLLNAARPVQLTAEQTHRLVEAIGRRVVPLGALSVDTREARRDEDRRCGYGQMLYLLDPNAAMPMLRETLERLHARETYSITDGCSAWISGALIASGDRGVAQQMASRIDRMEPRDGELASLVVWWRGLETRPAAAPAYEALARMVQDVREHPVETHDGRRETIYCPRVLSLVSRDSIQATPIRLAIITLLADRRLGAIAQYEGGSDRLTYVNARGTHTIHRSRPLETTGVIAPNTEERERLMDVVADHLVEARVLATPIEFDLRWVEPRRTQAIAQMVAQLR